MEPQSQKQPEAPQGATPPGLESYIGELGKNVEAVRSGIQNALEAVNSQETADSAVQKATQAVQAGNLSKEQFGQMVDRLPGQAIGYIYGSEGIAKILPPAESLDTTGMSEYDVDDLRWGDKHYTPGELNAMPKSPEDKAA